MPIYEYACSKCGADFEELVLGKEEAVRCPSCNSKRVKRALSVFSYSSGGTFHSSEGHSCDNCHKGSCSSCSCH